MAEPFKNLVDARLVRTAADHLVRAWPDFPTRRFVRQATTGLDELELKARVLHVREALAAALPDRFSAAADVLVRSLAPSRTDTDLSALQPGPDGLAGWIVWPMSEFVAAHGMRAPKRALAALRELTQRHTAEYAIRPFIVQHRELAFATLASWVDHRNPHVRRLVSEGLRPRLPWGIRLHELVEDPTPSLPLLERLQDDTSEYVRRSVANHLNDIAKDHPGVVADWLDRHLPAASDERRALLRHASRTLIKQGDRRVLSAWGLGQELRGEAALAIEPAKVRVGGAVSIKVTLRSSARSAQRLAVDYVVHHVRKRGTSAKTWKGWQLELAAGELRTLDKRHSLRPVTTRRDRPGHHAVDLVVNGRVVASGAFELLA